MQKSKKVGFLVEELSASQLSFNMIKNTNRYIENNDTDFVAFFENYTSVFVPMSFASMCVNEIWSFDGSLVATSASTALSISKTFAAESRFFYVWDLEWIRKKDESFETMIQAFCIDDVKLIARSEDHAKAIKNYSNRDVHGIVENFNTEQLMEIINNV